MFLAIFFASVLSRERFRGQNFFRIVFYIPNILSIAVIASIFAAVYGMDDGLINGLGKIISGAGFSKHSFFRDRQLVVYSITFAMLWQAIGYYIVMYMSSKALVATRAAL